MEDRSTTTEEDAGKVERLRDEGEPEDKPTMAELADEEVDDGLAEDTPPRDPLAEAMADLEASGHVAVLVFATQNPQALGGRVEALRGAADGLNFHEIASRTSAG